MNRPFIVSEFVLFARKQFFAIHNRGDICSFGSAIIIFYLCVTISIFYIIFIYLCLIIFYQIITLID